MDQQSKHNLRYKKAETTVTKNRSRNLNPSFESNSESRLLSLDHKQNKYCKKKKKQIRK